MEVTSEPQIEVSTKDNIVTRLPNEYYSAFIDPDNFHTDLVIPPSGLSEIMLDNTAQNSIGNEQYTYAALSNLLYSNSIERETDIVLTLKGIKTTEDSNARLSSIVLANGNNFDKAFWYDNGVGLQRLWPYSVGSNQSSYSSASLPFGNPNPYNAPAFGFCTDILNASLTSSTLTFGGNGGAVPSKIETPLLLDVLRRLLPNSDVDSHYGMRIPDKNYIQPTEYILAFPKVFPYVSGSAPNVGGLYASNIRTFRNFNTDEYNTYEDYENDANNVLSLNQRGGIWSLLTEGDVVFSKTIASGNYQFNSATKDFVQTGGDTTTLYTMRIGNGFYPTNVSNWRDALEYCGPSMLSWFTDKLTYKPRLATAADAGTVVGDLIFTREHSENRLNIAITFRNIKAPLYNSVLQDKFTGCWSNTTAFKTDLTVTNDYASLLKKWHNDGQNIVNSPNGTDVVANIRFQNSKLFMYQVTMSSLQSDQKKTSVLPYLGHEAQPPKNNSVTWTGSNTKTTATLNSGDISIGSNLPKYLMIYLSRPCKINALSVCVNAGTDLMQNRTPEDLFMRSKKAGLHQYSHNNITGYAGNKYSWVTNNMSYQYRDMGSGAILMLELCDIGMGSQAFVSGLGDKQMNIKYKITAEFDKTNEEINNSPATYTANVNLYVIHLLNTRLVITGGNAFGNVPIFYNKDVANAIQSFSLKAQTDKLYINVRKFFGGGIERMQKASSLIPKMFSSAKTANEIYEQNKPLVHDMINTGHQIQHNVKSSIEQNKNNRGTTTSFRNILGYN